MFYTLIVLLFFGLLFGRPQKRMGLRKVDFAHAGFIGVSASIYATFYLTKLHLDFPYFESDFVDYCINLIHFDDHDVGSDKRTRLAGSIAYILSKKFGIINGIAAASIASLAIIYGAIYLWATSISGKLAGLTAVFLALTMTPIISLGVILNFYPTLIAVFTLGGLTTALCIVKPKPINHVFAGIAIGLCLLVDVRGAIWGFSYLFGILAIGWAWHRSLSYNIALFICLVVPLFTSWHFADWSYPKSAKSLEAQVDVRPLFNGLMKDDSREKLSGSVKTVDSNSEQHNWRRQYRYEKPFIWGKSNLLDLPQTAMFLYEQTKITPPQGILNSLGNTNEHANYYQFWRVSLLASLCVIFIFSYRLKRLAALLVSGGPFLLAFIGTREMVEFQLRFYSHSLPFLAVCIGVASTSLMKGKGISDFRFKCVGFVVLMVFLFSMTTGAVQSELSPNAPWRPNWKANTKSLNEIQSLSSSMTNSQTLSDANDLKRPPSWQVDCALSLREESNTVWLYETIEQKLPLIRYYRRRPAK